MTFDLFQYTQMLGRLLDEGVAFATVTLVAIRGSAPQIVGAKAIVTADGIVAGTVGGGKIEAAAIAFSQSLLATETDASSCELVTWNLQTDIGMTCGGEVQLLVEVNRNNPWPIVVFGAGHLSQQLIPILLSLNCRVTCVDQRANWLDRLDNHRKLIKVCTDNLPAEVKKQSAHTFFALMTRGHASDLPILAEILSTRDAPYVGVIGSSQKASVLRRDLEAMGLSQTKIESYFCPMGLPFGNNTPAEIAISVVAQLLEQRDRWTIADSEPVAKP